MVGRTARIAVVLLAGCSRTGLDFDRLTNDPPCASSADCSGGASCDPASGCGMPDAGTDGAVGCVADGATCPVGFACVP